MKNIYSSLVWACAALAGVCQASYQNTAPLYVSSKVASGDAKYMEDFMNAHTFMQSFTENICSSQVQDILYLRAYGLQSGDLDTEAFQLFDNDFKTVYNNVVYSTSADVILSVHSSCSPYILQTENFSSSEDWISQIMNDDFSTHIVDLNSEEDLGEILAKLAMVFPSHNVIIQGVPVQQGSLNLSKKRHGESQEELSSDEIEMTLRDALHDVEEAIDESDNGFDDDGEQIDVEEDAVSSTKAKVVSGGLFDSYTFFTPGIWMATIVSLFMLYLVSVALSWLGSMQISYKAFDKPVDFEKKLQ